MAAADGGNPRRLDLTPQLRSAPFFSPDGTRIAFIGYGPNGHEGNGMWTADLAGENETFSGLGAEADGFGSLDWS